MPVDKHLNWIEITDFTAGLYNEQAPGLQLLGPNGAMVSLTDYEPRPMPGGGLRAFYQGKSIVTTGMDNAAAEEPMGVYGCLSGTSYDHVVFTMDPTDKKVRGYRMNRGAGASTWSKFYTDTAAGSAAFQEVNLVKFTTTGGTVYYICAVRGGANPGMYRLRFSDSNFVAIQAGGSALLATGVLGVSSARVIYGDGTTNLYYSDIGSVDIISTEANNLDVNPNVDDGDIMILVTVAPSDIIVGSQGAPWVEIDGDLSQGPALRSMGNDHHQRAHFQRAEAIPGGLFAFIEPGGKVFASDGRTFKSLSDTLKRFSIDASKQAGGDGFGPGTLAFLGHYLFAPGGFVYDFDTGAWFSTSILSGADVFHYADQKDRVYFTNGAVGVELSYMKIFEGGDSAVTRMPVASCQTVPFSDATGRNVRLREVQVYTQCYVESTITVNVLDSNNNIVSTWTEDAVTGRGATEFLFPNCEDDTLSVSITCSSNDNTSEAPTIERLRIAFGQNNILSGANAAQ